MFIGERGEPNLWLNCEIDSFQEKEMFIFIQQVCVSLKVGNGGRSVLQIFQKNFRSPGDHIPKYYVVQ